MICRNCGSYNPDSNSFCGNCGSSLQAGENGLGEKPSISEETDIASSPEPPESSAPPLESQPDHTEDQLLEKYCKYCKFKDKLLPSGDSYCSVCEQKAVTGAPARSDVLTGGLEGGPEVKIRSEVFIPEGRRTSRLKARMRERESSRRFYEKIPKATLIGIVILLLAGIAVLYVLRWQANQQKIEAGRKYLTTSEKLIKDYNKTVRRIGEIGNEVYFPDAGTFDKRRENALEEIEVLQKEVKEDYELAKETETGNKDLEPLKANIVKAYGVLLQVDLPELEDFARTVDVSIVRAMMKGNFSRSSFIGAVGISTEASSSIKEAIELWHKEENKLR